MSVGWSFSLGSWIFCYQPLVIKSFQLHGLLFCGLVITGTLYSLVILEIKFNAEVIRNSTPVILDDQSLTLSAAIIMTCASLILFNLK